MHFLSLTIRCVIKSIVLHLKSLARLGLQKGLEWPVPGTTALCTVAHICFLDRAGKHPGTRNCPDCEHSSLRGGQEKAGSPLRPVNISQSNCLNLAWQILSSASPKPSICRKARLPEGIRVKLGTQGY